MQRLTYFRTFTLQSINTRLFSTQVKNFNTTGSMGNKRFAKNSNNGSQNKKSKHASTKNPGSSYITKDSFNKEEFKMKTNWDWTSLKENYRNVYYTPSRFAPGVVDLLSRSEDPIVNHTGSTQFMEKHTHPLYGCLKTYPIDFIVREIHSDGQPVQIDSLDLPPEDILFFDENKREALEEQQRASYLEKITTMLTPEGFEEFKTFVEISKQAKLEKKRLRERIDELRALQRKKNSTLTPEERQARLLSYASSNQTDTTADEFDKEIKKCREELEMPYSVMLVDGLANPDDKEMRKQFHTTIREGFGTLLLTDTVPRTLQMSDGSTKQGTIIRVSVIDKKELNKAKSGNEKEKENYHSVVDARSIADGKWPASPDKKYLQFALYKRNLDSSYVFEYLARNFKIPDHHIGYCGLKDKRAMTVQLVTLARIHATRLRQLFLEYDKKYSLPRRTANIASGKCPMTLDDPIEKHLFEEYSYENLPDMVVGNFKYVTEGFQLGHHSGNHFSIKIRNIFSVDQITNSIAQNSDDKAGYKLYQPLIKEITQNPPLVTDEVFQDISSTVSKACRRIQESGFLNYFGHQRFGTFLIPSHKIGLEYLNGNYERLFYLLMYNLSTVYPNLIKLLEEGDILQAYNTLSPSFVREKSMLYSLMTHDSKDFQRAFFATSKSNRSIYTHAYQSWIFNLMLSARFDPYFWRKDGSIDVYQPMVGDIVLEKVVEPKPDEEIEAHPDDEKSEYVTGTAHYLTQEDIDSKKYTLSDIVLPLFRKKKDQPMNKLEKLQLEIIEADGVENGISNLKVDSFREDTHVHYRYLVTHPKDLKYEIQRAENGNVDLQLSFSLPPSAYATMLLREVLHSSIFVLYGDGNYTIQDKKASTMKED